MSIALIVYLIGILTTLKAIFIAWLVIFFATTLFCIFFMFVEDDKTIINALSTRYIKLTKMVIFSVFLSIVSLVVIPDKKDMYIIVGLHIGEQILTSEKGSAIFDKSYDAIMTELDDIIDKNTKNDSKETE